MHELEHVLVLRVDAQAHLLAFRVQPALQLVVGTPMAFIKNTLR